MNENNAQELKVPILDAGMGTVLQALPWFKRLVQLLLAEPQRSCADVRPAG